MDIEYNKPYTYKEICELMGEERQSGGDHIKKQLNRWRKKYIIDKPNKRGSKYTILGEIQGADKLVLPKRSKYAIYIVDGLLNYLSRYSDRTSMTLTYYELFEYLKMTNANYHKAKNNTFDEIEKYIDCISDETAQLYGTTKQMIILANLDRFFGESRKQLKELVDYAIRRLEDNQILYAHKTYKLYKAQIGDVVFPPHIATDKEISKIMEIQTKALDKLHIKSKTQLILSGNETYAKYQRIVLSEIKAQMGYDSYSQAIKFIYSPNSITKEYNYLNELQLNKNIQEKIRTSVRFKDMLVGLNEEFINEYINISH